jgi:hypothetical protein
MKVQRKMGAGISLMCGLLSGHFAPHRRRSYHRRNDFEAFLRETAPGLIPNAVIAPNLLALGFVILMTWGR